MLRIRLATTLAALALVTACSSADPTGDRLGGGTQDDTGSGSSSSTGSNKPSGSTSTTNGNTTTTQNPTPPAPTNPTTPASPVDAAKCGAEQTADACFSCCTGGNQDAFKVDDDAFGACICQNPGACSAQCGSSFCQGQQPTAACETCLNQNGNTCLQQADTACAADATCKVALDCVMAANCDQKQ